MYVFCVSCDLNISAFGYQFFIYVDSKRISSSKPIRAHQLLR